MTHSFYRLSIGALLLIFVYFEQRYLVALLVALLLLEGITNIRIPRLVGYLRRPPRPEDRRQALRGLAGPPAEFEAERVFSLTVAGILLLSYFLLPHPLWFMPWFLGFALLGSGASGFCPLILILKRLGFK